MTQVDSSEADRLIPGEGERLKGNRNPVRLSWVLEMQLRCKISAANEWKVANAMTGVGKELIE